MATFAALLDRQSGVAFIRPDRVEFHLEKLGGEILATISTPQLSVRIAGANSQHFYLEDRFNPAVSICVQDPGILRALEANGIHTARKAANYSRNRTAMRIALVASPFIFVILLLIGLPKLVGKLPPELLDSVVSMETEMKLGQHLSKSVSGASAEKTALQVQLQELTDHLKSHSPRLSGQPVQVLVSDSQESNAYALPGGIIIVNKGFLREAGSIEEVQGVLAHELAHVDRRHSFRALVKTLGSTAGFAILGLFTGMDAAAWIYKGTEIAGLKYSREQESEADRIGAEMLNSSGVGVAGLIAFFERKPKDSLGIEKHMAFLSTHPLSEERVATLKVLGSMPKSNENLTPRSFDELKKSL